MSEDLTEYLLELGIPVRILHYDIDTIQRVELVGINLLREGLDLPEVLLVAILDADKEGFLRSETLLIQTIGRAARNVEGEVVMYADRVTDSMQRAISETNRRRRAAGGLQRRARHRPADHPQGGHRHPGPPAPVGDGARARQDRRVPPTTTASAQTSPSCPATSWPASSAPSRRRCTRRPPTSASSTPPASATRSTTSRTSTSSCRAEPPGRVQRRVGFGQVVARVRHDRRGGAAPATTSLVRVRPPVGPADGTPDVDFIDELSTGASIDQKSCSGNPWSTVGTITEVYDDCGRPYAVIGVPHRPKCARADPCGERRSRSSIECSAPERHALQVLVRVARGAGVRIEGLAEGTRCPRVHVWRCVHGELHQSGERCELGAEESMHTIEVGRSIVPARKAGISGLIGDSLDRRCGLPRASPRVEIAAGAGRGWRKRRSTFSEAPRADASRQDRSTVAVRCELLVDLPKRTPAV